MKNFKVAMIVVFSVLALCLCGLLYWLMSFGSLNRGSSFDTSADYTLVQEKEFDPKEIAALSVRYPNSADVFFRESDGDKVIIREYMNFSDNEKYLSSIKLNGSTLVIEGKKRNVSFYFGPLSPDSYTEIWLPGSLCSDIQIQTVSGDIHSELSFTKCDRFSVSTTSGDIFFPGLESGNISVSSTSGDIRINKAEGESVLLSTTSGDIFLEKLTGEISLSTTSGDISVSDLKGDSNTSTTSGVITLGSAEGAAHISTISGDIRLDSVNGSFSLNSTSGEITVNSGEAQGDADSVSGDIRIFLSRLTGDFSCGTTSGCVSLALPEDGCYTLDFDSTSGECNTFFDDVLSFSKKGNSAKGQYGDNAGSRLDISTVSGDLRITSYSK